MDTGLDGHIAEILLVEDNPDDILLTQNILKKAKIRNPVQVLRDGNDALDFLFSTGRYSERSLTKEPQIILLDLGLPKVHGLDVLRKIKADERTKSIPVIILTSSQEERGVMQSYKLGAQGCIVKPFEISKFMEAVADLQFGWILAGNDEG